MDTDYSAGVFYAPFIPKIHQSVIEAKSRQLNVEWTFEQGHAVILNGYEIYTSIPMNDKIRVELSNIPFVFKLTHQDLFAWAITTLMKNEITKEIDTEIVEALIKQYK